jgi:biopolymer transport protein TolQ
MSPTPVNTTSVLALISQSGLVAKIVLLMLLGASITCWAIIFTKWKVLKAAHLQNDKFINIFWNSKSIDEIITKTEKFQASPVASVFKYAVKELRRVSGGEISSNTPSERLENVQRALMRASSSEIASLEKNVAWLATTASAAPFVGLFGTVWGIMNAFQNIGATGAANLAVVAPGISEALITTATGIAAAIPAVIAYNYFLGQIKKVAVDIDCFTQDFVNIVHRSLNSSQMPPTPPSTSSQKKGE